MSEPKSQERGRSVVLVLCAALAAIGLLVLLAEPIGYRATKGRLRALREATPTEAQMAELMKPGRLVAELVTPAVVGISTESELRFGPESGSPAPAADPESAPPARDPFELPRTDGDNTPDAEGSAPPDTEKRDPAVDETGPSLVRESVGSGFIIDADRGHIITNAHVVAGTSRVEVRLADGRVTTAEVLGLDPESDLAVLRISLDRLHAVPWGSSSGMAVGDEVYAAGSPFGLDGTFSKGIISALNRPRDATLEESSDTFLQTDALITPGSSGGPLVNLRGEVIGINTAMATHVGAFEGVGFAIPARRARELVPDLIEGGPAQLGVWVGSVSVWRDEARRLGWTEPYGALVTDLIKGRAGEAAGLKEGDVILAFNGARIGVIEQLGAATAALTPGTEVTLHVWREGKEFDLPLTLGRRYAP